MARHEQARKQASPGQATEQAAEPTMARVGEPGSERVGQSLYYAGTWHDLPRWACPHCPFDSLVPGEVEQHVQQRHIRRAPRTTRPTPLLDKFGNRIPVEEG